MVPILKVNYAFLVPWIVFSLPAAVFFDQQLYILSALLIVGLVGMLLRISNAVYVASAGLLVLIAWGKAASDIFALPGEDSAVLLLQFMIVIFLMEASNTVLIMDSSWIKLKGKEDELSIAARFRLVRWASAQLVSLGKLTAAAFGLSILLLLVGGFANVSVSLLAFNGILVLAAVISILILLTYKREPEQRSQSKD